MIRKLLKIAVLIAFFGGLFLVVVAYLSDPVNRVAFRQESTAYRESAKGQENYEKIQLAKDAAQEEYFLTQKAKHALEREEYEQRKRNVRQNIKFWADFWGITLYGLVFGSLALIVCVGIGVMVGIVKIATINANLVGQALVIRGQHKEALRLAIEEERTHRERLKLYGKTALFEREQDAIPETIDLSPAAPDAFKCLADRTIEPSSNAFFLGVDVEQTPKYYDLREAATGIKVGGKQQKGKTNTLRNIAAQSLLKGWLNLWIDLHNPHQKSFVVNMGALAHVPNVRIHSKKEEAIQALYCIDSLLDKRLQGEYAPDIPVLIVIDEILNLVTLLRKDNIDAAGILKRVNTEGAKSAVFLLAAAHTWTAEEVGSTGWRDAFDCAIAHKMDRLQVDTFGIKSKSWKARCEQLSPGEAILLDHTGEFSHVRVPFWSAEAIEKAAGMVQHRDWPDVEEPTAEDLEHYQQKVIRLSDYQIRNRLLQLRHGEKKRLAKMTGIPQQTISRIVTGKVTPQQRTLSVLRDGLNELSA